MSVVGLPLKALWLASGIVGGWEFLAFIDGRRPLGRWRCWIEASMATVWVGGLVLLGAVPVSPTVVATIALSLVCFLPPACAAVPALVLAGGLGWLNPWHAPGVASGMMIAGVAAALMLSATGRRPVWAFPVPLVWAVTTALLGTNRDGWLDALAWVVTAPPLWMYVNERGRRARVLTQARFEADHDPLTGLGNRRLLDGLPDAPGGTVGAMLAVDLDDFKLINDTFGHPAGDSILVGVAERLRRILRSQDLGIRMGGDEFLCWAPGVTGQAAGRWADNIRNAVSGRPFVVAGQEIWVRVSCGLAEGPLGVAVIQQADQALLSAKGQGKDRVVGRVHTAGDEHARATWGWLSGTASTVLAHSALGFVLLDEQRRVVAMNAAYARLAGYPPGTLPGHPLVTRATQAEPAARADGEPDGHGLRWHQRPDGTAWAAEEWESGVYVSGALAGYALLARPVGPNAAEPAGPPASRTGQGGVRP